MSEKPKICVYCGSARGRDPRFLQAARMLGTMLAAEGMGLIYGGGDNGLMGEVARAALAGGGHVTGIIPQFLNNREHMLQDVQELVVVADMHSRKREMYDRADAFIALPGGVGTLEELVEQLTWVQLGRHTKPVVIADIGEFWRPLLVLFEHMRDFGFIRAEYPLNYLVARHIEEALPLIRTTLDLQRKSGETRTDLDPRL